MKLEDFKYSYNKYNKIYNLEILENGKWRRCVLDENSFKKAIEIKFRTKENTRNNPYKPYIKYRIKWGFMNLWEWIKKTDPKIKYIINSGTFITIGFLVMFFIDLWLDSKKQNTITKYEKEVQLKDQTIQNYKAFSDSLLIEIKKKELTIKDFELAHPKDSTLMIQNEILKKQ